MILGIDTSNYRTSICLLDESGELKYDGRRFLQVPEGQRGLQQSAALFGHIKSLPLLFSEMQSVLNGRALTGIGFSAKPRPLADSYMPVFEAGGSFAKSLASILSVPLFATTHQEGHLAAGEATIMGVREETRELLNLPEFLGIHLSGGTTDLLRVQRSFTGYKIEELGTGLDLHAGQFVDRVGVALGLAFPAGPALEKLAASLDRQMVDLLPIDPLATLQVKPLTFPSPVRGLNISFSGPLTAAERAIDAGYPANQIARAVEGCIAKALEKVLLKAKEESGLSHVLVVGGVAANVYIRKRLSKRLEHPAAGMKLYFAKPEFSSDNAYGVARLAYQHFHKK